jgi:hypothetical protein
VRLITVVRCGRITRHSETVPDGLPATLLRRAQVDQSSLAPKCCRSHDCQMMLAGLPDGIGINFSPMTQFE